ncbi:MAG: alkaline phosphatase D family protein [Candidatus Neomarinimicrobiota bacterium]|nr:alkaline phosphatase D family protein [Candidatus Neomarinimicrobiota bacterium]
MIKNPFFTIILLAVLFIDKTTAAEIEYFWSGSITEEGATICVASDTEAKIKVQYSDNKNFKRNNLFSKTIKTSDKSHYFSKLRLSNLKSQKTYYYRFSVNGVLNKNRTGKFQTHSDKPFSYEITLATCATTGSNNPVFDRIREEKSLFYLMLGDFNYGNIRRDCEDNFLTYYRATLGSKKQSKLYQNTPIAYMWDDHDYGPNNSSGISPNQYGYIACQPEARKAYKNYVPHYPLAFEEDGKVISQSFSVGRVTYLLTDLRSEKRRPLFQGDCENPNSSNCKKTKQGSNFGSDEHLQWFKNQLLEAKNNNFAVVWHSSFPYLSSPDLSWFNCDEDNTIKTKNGYECDDHDNWGWYPEEREEVANFIKNNDIPVCIVSGDAHMSAIDDGTNSDYATNGGAPIPILHAGPLDRKPSIKGGPYSHGVSGIRGQYGIMKITDNGGDELCIEWKIKNYKGEFVLNTEGELLQYSFCFQLDN